MLGVVGLAVARRAIAASRLLYRGLGWVLLVTSIPAWLATSGAEYGTVFACMAFSMAGVLAVLAQTRWREPAASPAAPRGTLTWAVRPWMGQLARFLIVVPLAGISSALAAIVVAVVMPVGDAGRIVIQVLIAPVLWGVTAVWVLLSPSIRTPVIALLAASAVGGSIVAVG